ncbi:HAD family phosphatase [Nitrososphaera sp.]|uniref:HAD family hydrolase n=1 Tax=Nitrososphaera sp. TaxID=1971748 RepID=UPI00180C3E7D|nr:HAD family phosphatase [Nitrososphaera sp.]NWG38292.1 HAD-IB family phosphatase [Nitrososphaera sp.]
MKLAAFDMDGTLLDGRLVFALSERMGLDGRVRAIQSDEKLASHEKTAMIAGLFAGVTRRDVESAVESIPLSKNAEQAVSALKGRDYKTGIISDSYTAAAGVVASRLGMDFVAANDLVFENSVATGRVNMPMGWEKIGCFCHLSVCKRYHLEKYADMFGVQLVDTLAVGDTRADICMIRRAGFGVAFMPKDDDVRNASENVVATPDMMQVIRLLDAAP